MNAELKKVARRTSRVKELMSNQFTNIYGYRFHYMSLLALDAFYIHTLALYYQEKQSLK
jgi:hypothetical protein